MLSGRWSDFTKKYDTRGRGESFRYPQTGTSTFQSPELSNLKHSPYARRIPVGFTGGERRDIYARGREEIQGATETAMEQMREKMGGRGFRAGESGIADTILADIAKTGAKQLGEYSRDISIEDARKRFAESMALEQFGLQERGMEHGEQIDWIQALMNLFGMGMQGQQARWAPYWQGLTSGYMNLG